MPDKESKKKNETCNESEKRDRKQSDNYAI